MQQHPKARRRRWISGTAVVLGAMVMAVATAPTAPASVAAPSRAAPTTLAFATPRVGYLLTRSLQTAQAIATLYRTADGGRRWSIVQALRVGHSSFGDAHGALAMRGRRGAFLAFLGGGACQGKWQVWTTADGGRRWQSGPPFFGSDGPSALTVDGMGSGLVTNGSCAAANAGVWRYAVDGRVRARPVFRVPSRTRAAPGPAAASVHAASGRTLLALAFEPSRATGPPLLIAAVTRDGGKNWRRLPFGAVRPAGSVLAASVPSPDAAVVVMSNAHHLLAVMSTRDAGQRWAAGDLPALPPGLGVVGLCTPTPRVAFLLLQKGFGQDVTLLTSTDGGRTWDRRHLPAGV